MVNNQGTVIKDNDGRLWAVTEAGRKRYLEESDDRWQFVVVLAVIASIVLLGLSILVAVFGNSPQVLFIYPLVPSLVWLLAKEAGSSYERTIIESLGKDRVHVCKELIYRYLDAADRDILITLGQDDDTRHWVSAVHQFEEDLVSTYNAELDRERAEKERCEQEAIDRSCQKVTQIASDRAPVEG